MTKTIHIDGMMCEHCRSHVEKALKEVPSVTAVSVSLADKTARVISDGIDDAVLSKAIADAGYTVAAID